MADDQGFKIVTGAHMRPLPPAGSHEHPAGTVIEAPDGRRFQVGYGGEKYVWQEVVPDLEAEKQSADQTALRRAQLEAELAALPAPRAAPATNQAPETPDERIARLRAELAAAETGTP